MKVWENIINNKVYQSILCILTLVVPVQTFTFIGNSNAPNVFGFLWIGFYSSILLCLSAVNKGIKIVAILINVLAFLVLTVLFLMGGAEIIPGMILKMILPFVPNPWL